MAILDYVGIYSALVGALYIYVGFHVGHREVQRDGRLALRLFQVWWFGLGLGSLLGAMRIVLFRLELLSIPIHAAIGQLNLFLIVAALWGLLYYLWYLYTGSRKAIVPLTIMYAIFYALLSAWIASAGTPDRIVEGRWSLQTEPQPETRPFVTIALLLGLVGPQIAAAVAYFRLFFLAETPTQKYRIALVAGAIIVWFGLSIVASIITAVTGSEFTDTDGWEIFSRALSLTAVLAILAAYKPPHWVQRKYHVEAV